MAIKSYAYNDNTQLSAHFNVQEFKCKCGNPHSILISEETVKQLEALYNELVKRYGDDIIITINSGYRCYAHDKAVGGSGTGQHTKGTAVDIRCRQNGAIVTSKLICCIAQDLGFSGIANINAGYTDTHLDMRSGSKWYGDETKGNGTVTADFYSYFGITREHPVDVPHGTIRKGDRGDEVLWLQARLFDFGYLTKPDIDGIFGIKTQRALVCFQFENGLTVDGICGDMTKNKLK